MSRKITVKCFCASDGIFNRNAIKNPLSAIRQTAEGIYSVCRKSLFFPKVLVLNDAGVRGFGIGVVDDSVGIGALLTLVGVLLIAVMLIKNVKGAILYMHYRSSVLSYSKAPWGLSV